MWRQVRETGREGLQERDRRLLKKRTMVEGTGSGERNGEGERARRERHMGERRRGV